MASGGARSLLAPWIGGASSPEPQPGFRSLFAFWVGGACAVAPSTTPEPTLGGGASSGYRHKVARGRVYGQTKPPTCRPFRARTGVVGKIAGTLRKPTVSVTARVGVTGRVAGTTKPPVLSIVSRQYDFSEDELLAVVAAVSMMKDRDAPSS